MLSHLSSRRWVTVGISRILATVQELPVHSFKDLKNNKWISLRMRQGLALVHEEIVQLVKVDNRRSMWTWSESQIDYIRINLTSNLIWEEELAVKARTQRSLNSNKSIQYLLRLFTVIWATKLSCKRQRRIKLVQPSRNSSRSHQIRRTK